MLSQFLKQSPSPTRVVAATFRCWMVIVSATMLVSAQSRIISPERRPTPATRNTATVRSYDSPQGSRVTVTSNRSLLDYEAFRQGDRFYVRIPVTDVPSPGSVRGRAFADVKMQRGATDTVVSFRLQPGATARVEQGGNKLDIVFTIPSVPSDGSTPAGRDIASNDAGPAPSADYRGRDYPTVGPTRGSSSRPSRNTDGGTGSASARLASTPRPTPSPKATATPLSKTSPTPAGSVTPSGSPHVAQQRSSPSPTTTVSSGTAQGTTWSKTKQRVRYWILMAQLNPLPVGIGVAVLLMLIGLLVLQRRRAKLARRTSSSRPAIKSESTPESTPVAASSTGQVAPREDNASMDRAATANALAPESPAPRPSAPVDAQHERVTRVSEEVKKLMAGGNYDQSVIASDDRYMRQLVGAELLSALVGRNLQRRERARAAFMNHGYFDDATRDLRIAESANERAAAARRLSFLQDREATPHLVAALEDASPDVRRAAVEALMDLRDPGAIPSLNSLMKTENDRRVPQNLIKHAIEACAIGGSDASAVTPLSSALPSPAPASMLSQAESEREVIEI